MEIWAKSIEDATEAALNRSCEEAIIVPIVEDTYNDYVMSVSKKIISLNC